MAETPNILYCTRMNRPCTCGELTVYDRKGRIALCGRSSMRCLTQDEVRDALTVAIAGLEGRVNGEGARA